MEVEFPATMIKAQGNSRLAWDLLIIVFSIYQSFTIPIELSFGPDFFNRVEMRTLDSFIDLVFTLDIIFRFRSTYIDPISGEEVIDFYLISQRYLFSYQFVIDVISTVPINDIAGGENGNAVLEFIGLLKIFRIFRI